MRACVASSSRRVQPHRVSVVGYEAGGDEDRVSAQEDGRGRVDGQVGARTVRGAEAAVRVGRPVRLTCSMNGRVDEWSGKIKDSRGVCMYVCMYVCI